MIKNYCLYASGVLLVGAVSGRKGAYEEDRDARGAGRGRESFSVVGVSCERPSFRMREHDEGFVECGRELVHLPAGEQHTIQCAHLQLRGEDLPLSAGECAFRENSFKMLLYLSNSRRSNFENILRRLHPEKSAFAFLECATVQCYAEKQALGKVSREAWEIGGHMVLKRRKDYEEASEDSARRLLAEVSLSAERFRQVKGCIFDALGLAVSEEESEANESLDSTRMCDSSVK